jgi:hypothetical protein
MKFDWELYSERLEIGSRNYMFRIVVNVTGPYKIWQTVYSPLKGDPKFYEDSLYLISELIENEFGQRPSVGAIKNQINYVISNQKSIPRIEYFEACSLAAIEEGFITADFLLKQQERYLTNKI